ncbi:MAG: molybdopterin-dependent oxidoreductase [Acidimicrobiia bacterium]|nr:molybdopterin-dependent oxidoreductase [Acidimicrobiia bacterium]
MSVGSEHVRIDALGKVTGETPYPDDLDHDNALYGKVVFSGQPHARMISMDTTAAKADPDVIDVFTAADVPVNEYGLTMYDQPVLVGLNATGRAAVASDISRWEADQIAFVVATSVEAAERGAAAIEVEWEQLPIVGDIDDALNADQVLHPEQSESNTYYTYRIRKGDMAVGWEAADVIVEGTYEVPHQEHAYLQPESGVGYIDPEGRITVKVAGQWTYEDLGQIMHALDLPEERVRVVYAATGGAFGGREDMSVQIVLALAAWKLGEQGEKRAIHTTWSREESIVGHHKRHRGRIHTKWGATNEGRITAVEAVGYLDAGAYNYTSNKVLGNLHLTVGGPYDIPNAHIDSHAVYTNTVPGGAFRGFGAPQGAFVAESQMNKLAAALDKDTVEIRLMNCLREGDHGITQAELPRGVSLPEVIEGCRDRSEWGAPPQVGDLKAFESLPASPDRVKQGRGFACAYKNIGFSFGFPERCDARIELHGDDLIERVVLAHGAAEVGQGSHTALAQMAAEATGVELDQVEGVFADTATSGDSGSVSASRMTWMAGNAILGAAEEAEKSWLDGDRPAIGEFRFVPPPTEMLDPETGVGQPNFAYGYVAEAVDVAVDVDTGHIRVGRVVCATDVGRAINPNLIEGQVEGAVVQAHGYTLSENLQVADGHILNPRFSGYLIPGVLDIPEEVDSQILEFADPRGPFGVRGMAEMPFIPYAPAVVAALYDATGVWFDEFPLTPSRVLAGLKAAAIA